MPDVSIAISAKDNFSDAITTMRNSNQAFNKDLTGTMEKLNALNKNKITLKVDTDKARDALKDTEKQYKATGSAADKLKMEMASANYDNAKRNLDLVSKNAKEAEKNILNMTDAVEKSDNRASKVSGSSGISGAMSKLAGAGLTKMLGDSASGAAQAYITSALGSETGNAVNSVLSGVTSGAAIGSIIPGVGTAIGAAVGGVSGAITAAAKTFSDKDETFKSVVQESYNSIKSDESSSLSSGSSTASTREQNQISFSTLLGGSDKAGDFLSGITDFAAKTPFEYDQLTTISRTLLAYGYKQEEIIPLLTKVGDTGSALGMSSEDMNYVATALGRMKSTGKTTMEYLNPLLERGVPVWDYLAKSTGKTKAQVQEMVSKGLMPGATAAKDIADSMGEANKNSMELQSQTYSGLKSTLEDAETDLNASMGNGYNEELKKGMQNEINTLSGSTGSALKEAYSMEGKFKAQLENSQKKLLADAYTSVTSGVVTGDFSRAHKKELQQLSSDFLKNKQQASRGDTKAGEQAARDVEKAKIIAANEYKATEGYKLEQQGDLDLITSIQDDTALQDEYWDAGYTMGKKFSSGLAKAYEDNVKKGITSWDTSGFTGSADSSKSTGRDRIINGNIGIGAHATGINRVPYNNFPALLHEGETVSTAVEARSQKSGGIKIEVSGPVTVRKESDIDDIANRLLQKIKRANMVMP